MTLQQQYLASGLSLADFAMSAPGLTTDQRLQLLKGSFPRDTGAGRFASSLACRMPSGR